MENKVFFSFFFYFKNQDAKSFLLSSYLGPAPLPPQLIQPQWLPLSFSLTHRAGTCLPLLAGWQGWTKSFDSKKAWFSSLLLFHAYMQSHSFNISIWY
jgi:hypothetical protein